MREGNNPFTLMFGAQPSTYIERYSETQQILDTFRSSAPTTKLFLLDGVRGSGKTVLMTSVADKLSENKEWVVINLNPRQDLLTGLANRLGHLMHTSLNLRETGLNISAAGFGIGIGGSPADQDTINILEDLLEKSSRKKKKILVTIDEVLHDDNMRNFASQYQIFIREKHPLYLLMTGLYENINAIQNDPALTFLLRAPKIRIGPLQASQIVFKYKTVFKISEDEAERLAATTRGYAFAFQALGNLYWNHAQEYDLDDITLLLDAMLDEQVYRKIWSDMTGLEKKIVLAIGKAGDARIKDISAACGISQDSIGQYRLRLIGKGIAYSPSYGHLALTLPRFYEVVKRY